MEHGTAEGLGDVNCCPILPEFNLVLQLNRSINYLSISEKEKVWWVTEILAWPPFLFSFCLHSNQRCWWNKRMDRREESSIKYWQLWTRLGQRAGSAAQAWRLWERLGSSWRQGEDERVRNAEAFLLSSRGDCTIERIIFVFFVFIFLFFILGEFSWWNCPASDPVTSRISWRSSRKMYWVEPSLE